MKATIKTINVQVPIAIIEHGGVSLEFTISVFGRSALDKEDPFMYLNQYWECLSEEHQANIFRVYQELYNKFDDFLSREDLFEYASIKSAELLDLHNIDHIRNWMAFKSDIQIPAVIPDDYKDNIDDNLSREKTYTKSEYRDLICLSLALRSMIPVWGEYIFATRKEYGTRHKELYAFLLIRNSAIKDSAPMVRLAQYISLNIGSDKFDIRSIEEGTSSEDFCHWMLALICIRRLCVGLLKPTETYANLCTSIHNFLSQKIISDNPHPEDNIRLKDEGTADAGDKEKMSVLEKYRSSTDLSPGQVVELEHELNDIITKTMRLCPSLNVDFLRHCILTAEALYDKVVGEPQVKILKYVFNNVIPARGVDFTSEMAQIHAMGAAQAILWSKGHKYLALLVTSHVAMNDGTLVVSSTDHRKRVATELEEELFKYYPFTVQNTGRKAGPTSTSLIVESIGKLADEIANYSWKPTADADLITELFGSYMRKLPANPEIKILLTRFAIDVGSGRLFV